MQGVEFAVRHHHNEHDEDYDWPSVVARSAEANMIRPAFQALLLGVGLGTVTALNKPAIADKLDAASIPTGAVYVCAVGAGKDRKVTTIELQEKVAALCRRHTEMGPCQSARNSCRRSGGRVYAADGSEITQADEAEYDKKVTRMRVGP